MKKKHSRPVVASSVTMASSVTSISATLTPVTSTPVTLTPVKDIEKELNGIDKEVAGLEESLVAAEETTKFPDDEVSLQQQASTPNSLSSEKSAKSGKSKNEKIREKPDAKTKKVEEEEEDEAPVEKETPATCNGSNASDEDMSVSRSGDMSICRSVSFCLIYVYQWKWHLSVILKRFSFGQRHQMFHHFERICLTVRINRDTLVLLTTTTVAIYFALDTRCICWSSNAKPVKLLHYTEAVLPSACFTDIRSGSSFCLFH